MRVVATASPRSGRRSALPERSLAPHWGRGRLRRLALLIAVVLAAPSPSVASPGHRGQLRRHRSHVHGGERAGSSGAAAASANSGSSDGNGGSVFDVTAFGAVGDGKTNNTASFRAAAAAAARAGGGVILVPPGVYLTGSFNLSSHVVLRIAGGIVSGIRPASVATAHWDYPLLPWRGTGGSDAYGGSSDFQGRMGPQFSSLVHAFDAVNVTIDGGGEIHGGGDFWWKAMADKALGGVSRPHCVHIVNVSTVTVRDVTVRRSPSWTVHLTFCRDVLVERLLVQTNDSVANGGNSTVEPFNADGIDLDSCTNAVVRDSRFYTNDDSIALKSGKDWFGRAIGVPTSNVTVTNCAVDSRDGGVVVGSEMSGGIRDVMVENLECFGGGAYCLWIKSARNRGGVVERVRFTNITSRDTSQSAITFDMFYTGPSVPAGNASSTPAICDVTVDGFAGVVGAGLRGGGGGGGAAAAAPPALWFRGLPESVISSITLSNVVLRTGAAADASLKRGGGGGKRGTANAASAPVALCQDARVTAVNTTVNGVAWAGCSNNASGGGGGGGGGDPPSGGVPARQSPACQPPPAGNWTECRRQLIAEMFGTNGSLPSRSDPDWVIPQANYTMHGWPSAGQGCTPPGGGSSGRHGNGGGGPAASWRNNLTALVWKLDPLPPVPPAGALCADAWPCVYVSSAPVTPPITGGGAGDTPSPEWRFSWPRGPVVHVPTGRCLAALALSTHARVGLAPCEKAAEGGVAPTQVWVANAAGEFQVAASGNGSAGSGPPLCLNVFMPMTKAGGEAQLYPCDPPNAALPNERWSVNASDGTVRTMSMPGARGLTYGVPAGPAPPPSKPIELNTTVFYSLNTSLAAPGNYPPFPLDPGVPSPQRYAASRGDTLLLYHNGHETASCTPNYDGVVDNFNELGFDVMELMMPLLGCNARPNLGTSSHQWFEQFEQRGVHTIKYFVEPVVLAVNYAVNRLGYKRVVMLGLSGGGWTTTLASAVDARIEASFPTAGSVPFGVKTGAYGPSDKGDYEQLAARPIYSVCNFTCMYVLAGLETGRAQVQILHENDPCCFRAEGRHGEIAAYDAAVQRAGISGWMRTAVTSGNFHQVNQRDKVIVAHVVEALRNGARPDGLGPLPFDIL